MKRKAISKKIEVKNKSFIKAISVSSIQTSKIHLDIVKNAKKSGVLSKLAVSK